jgi:tRNA(Ile)-lysidine synthase
LELLLKRSNLLAFSAGIDSTALFFKMLRSGVEFDIAIVDYKLRSQSKEEIAYAKELAHRYKKRVFIKEVELCKSNFEHYARGARYSFFEEIIKEYSYDNLVTAHQLDDRVEWFFMQLSKGAGVIELIGFNKVEQRDGYRLIRPLINSTKEELLDYLKSNSIKYFLDKSNTDIKYKRNYIRERYTKEFLDEFKDGILKSLNYLQIDANNLFKVEVIKREKKLTILKRQDSDLSNIRAIDKEVKRLGVLLSKSTKDEILRQKDIVISNRVAVCITSTTIYIAPYVKVVMDKKFKELCRVKRIPPKVRGYIKEYNLLDRF